MHTSNRRGPNRIRLGGLAMAAACAVGLCSTGCAEAQPPPYVEVFELTGSAYERGFQHGQRFRDKIGSLYSMLIETNLVRFLNREQADVMAFLEEYRKPEYQDGRFSYEMMLQSGRNLLEILREHRPEVVEELKGLRDGSQLEFDKILVLNTFVDTMLSFRSVTFFIRQLQAPRIMTVEVLADLSQDGVDNNGDGLTDEPDDQLVKSFSAPSGWSPGYSPRTRAALVELPPQASLRLTFYDPPGIVSFDDPDGEPKEGEIQGMDPGSIRIQVDGSLYTPADRDCLQTALWGEDDKGLEVIFTPRGGWPRAASVTLYIQAANLSQIVNPPPVHPRTMRDERITLTTSGFGRPVHLVPNRGRTDEGTMPASLAFAVRNSATPDGQIRLGQHFALLDSNISHKHTVLLVHRPTGAKAFAQLGWAGVIWGFSGMNEDGLTYAVMPSDTLDNPFAGQVKRDVWNARLLSTGIPAGLKGRGLLERASTVAEARELLAADGNTFGWNYLLADAQRDMLAIEADANVLGEPDGGFLAYGPDPTDPQNLDRWGLPLASVGPDDLRIGMHFAKNTPDIDTKIIVFDVQPQFLWSTFFYKSLRTQAILGERIARGHGRLGKDELIEILRDPGLVDERESMNAAVFEPEQRRLWYAMGQMPASAGPFFELDLGAWLQAGANP